MSAVSRFLGTAAALAVVGVGAAALGKLLKKQQEMLDAARANTEEDALEQAAAALDEEELAEAAALDADAVTADAAREAAEQEAEAAARQAHDAAEAKPAFGAAPQNAPIEPLAGYTPRPDHGPNANPVLGTAASAGRRPDGSIDPEKICSPDDFGDWEDLGCQG
ncbi:MAG: hypothetical protein LKJ90_02005 [Faecalibacterium sp.]|jgi:septal ring factor EnvC (AmiA/AmiB activator)|nr:hypothetical protein [Faecalibacterium sp.]